MDATHLHLILNHVPVVGLGVVILCLIVAVLSRSADLSKFGLALAVLMALVAIPVFLSGEPAEESVEHLTGVHESIIEAHEESAEIAFGAVLTIGAGALALLLSSWRRATILARGSKIMLGACIIAAGLMGRTANLGGQIRHSEIRTTALAGDSDGVGYAHKNSHKNDAHDSKQN